MAPPIIYMIRHGEKPNNGENILSKEGLARAQRLRKFFGRNSAFNIGYIMAERPGEDSKIRPYETVQPLAEDLAVKLDISIDRDDAEGVANAVKAYRGTGNILICWEHRNLSNIAKRIGVKKFAPSSGWHGQVHYPDSRFDLVWVSPAPYGEITEVISEDTGAKATSNGD